MRVSFLTRDNGPERLVCDGEILFEEGDGPLAGMKLVGFALWRNGDEVSVTFPSRSFGSGGERRFFDYLRSADGTTSESRRVKDWILEEFRASKRAA